MRKTLCLFFPNRFRSSYKHYKGSYLLGLSTSKIREANLIFFGEKYKKLERNRLEKILRETLYILNASREKVG